MVAMVSYHWLVPRCWRCHPLNCWMLRFRLDPIFLRKQPPSLVSHGFSKASWMHWRMDRMRGVRRIFWKQLSLSRCLVLVPWGIYQCRMYIMGQATRSWSSSGPWLGPWCDWSQRYNYSHLARYWYSTDLLTLSLGPLFHSDINSAQGWYAGKFQFSLHFILIIFYPFWQCSLDITLNHNDDRGVSTTNRDLVEKPSLIPFMISE